MSDCIPLGSYVLATKYEDGDPGDPWAVGYLLGVTERGLYLVGPEGGESYRRNGYRRAQAGLTEEMGRWLVENSAMLERSPPGSINLWGMLGVTAFESNADRECAARGGQAE